MDALPKAGDYTDIMHQFVEGHTVSNGHMHNTADVTWRDTVPHFCASVSPNFTGMTKKQKVILFTKLLGVSLVPTLFQRLNHNILDLSIMVFSTTVLLLLMRGKCSV